MYINFSSMQRHFKENSQDLEEPNCHKYLSPCTLLSNRYTYIFLFWYINLNNEISRSKPRLSLLNPRFFFLALSYLILEPVHTRLRSGDVCLETTWLELEESSTMNTNWSWSQNFFSSKGILKYFQAQCILFSFAFIGMWIAKY